MHLLIFYIKILYYFYDLAKHLFIDRLYFVVHGNRAVTKFRVSISNLCISDGSILPLLSQPARYYTPINSRNRIFQSNRAT